jgi:hypothetical protein
MVKLLPMLRAGLASAETRFERYAGQTRDKRNSARRHQQEDTGCSSSAASWSSAAFCAAAPLPRPLRTKRRSESTFPEASTRVAAEQWQAVLKLSLGNCRLRT